MGEVLYIAVCRDHHCDDTIRPFSTETKARAQCALWLRDLPRYTLPHIEKTLPGYLYFCTYGDNDHVRIEVHTLDAGNPL